MNNNVFFFFIVLSFGCQPQSTVSKNENIISEVLLKDTVKMIIDNIDRKVLQLDTSIMSIIKLDDWQSTERFYKKHEEIEILDNDFRSTPTAIFCNDKQYLIAYQYEGGTKLGFSCFEVGYLKNIDTKKYGHLYKVPYKDFYTENGIKLGMPKDSVIAKKGYDFEMIEFDVEILKYHIEDMQNDFVQRYSAPGYFMEYLFKDDKLIAYKFGFDYP